MTQLNAAEACIGLVTRADLMSPSIQPLSDALDRLAKSQIIGNEYIGASQALATLNREDVAIVRLHFSASVALDDGSGRYATVSADLADLVDDDEDDQDASILERRIRELLVDLAVRKRNKLVNALTLAGLPVPA